MRISQPMARTGWGRLPHIKMMFRLDQKYLPTYPIKMLAHKLNKSIIPRITKHFARELCIVPGRSLRTTRLSRPSPVQSHMAWAYHAP